jgi:hypothetical protein
MSQALLHPGILATPSIIEWLVGDARRALDGEGPAEGFGIRPARGHLPS